MILRCFYMSIPVIWSGYSFMCLDCRLSHLHGRLVVLPCWLSSLRRGAAVAIG